MPVPNPAPSAPASRGGPLAAGSDAVPHPSGTPGNDPQAVPAPSRWYRAEVWRLGQSLIQRLPLAWTALPERLLAALFWQLDPSRRSVVIRNLLPVLAGDSQAATRTARRLYRQFARKIVDLWRYEAGRPFDRDWVRLRDLDRFQALRQGGRGLLFVTPHLGNWELGAPALADLGLSLLTLTLAEPHQPLTEVRRQARARGGIETLVVQQDPFAFLEVVRRLEAGGAVALLIDRPPAALAAPAELFGQSTQVSLAPAELARATGCLVLPVFVVHTGAPNYQAALLPEVPYDRAALRHPEARADLAGRILRTFEPVIRQYADQWYHFVPVWQNIPRPLPAR